mgnify:CR=1 FL=1
MFISLTAFMTVKLEYEMRSLLVATMQTYQTIILSMCLHTFLSEVLECTLIQVLIIQLLKGLLVKPPRHFGLKSNSTKEKTLFAASFIVCVTCLIEFLPILTS